MVDRGNGYGDHRPMAPCAERSRAGGAVSLPHENHGAELARYIARLRAREPKLIAALRAAMDPVPIARTPTAEQLPGAAAAARRDPHRAGLRCHAAAAA